MGGTDVTFYRGVPCEVEEWVLNEPFGPASASIRFPQVSIFELLPAWLSDWSTVLIQRVRPDNSVQTLWAGWLSVQSSSSSDGVFVADCIGKMYQSDLLIRKPAFRDAATDMGVILAEALNPGSRYGTLVSRATGVLSSTRGSWNPLLTGFAQDLLATATVPTDVGGNGGVGFDILPDNSGYYMVSDTGNVVPFAMTTPYEGGMGARVLNKPVVGIAVRSQGGYWLAAQDGGVFALGAPFYGSLVDTPLNGPIVAVIARPTGAGYWLVGEDGGVFGLGDADAHFYGNATEAAVDAIVGADRTDSGNGYWLVDALGRVYAYGDAPYRGGNVTPGVVAISRRKLHDGYWIVFENGLVQYYGNQYAHYGDMSGALLAAPIVDIVSTPSGNGYYLAGADGGVFAFGDADYQGSVVGLDGVANQWTLLYDLAGNAPYLKVKDRINTHWTVRCGADGVEHNLTRDPGMSPNALYGEGIADDNCRWRNSRYPAVDDPLILPLAVDPAVEPYRYATDGTVIGSNPSYVSGKMRVEHYENMGDGVAKAEGVNSAHSELMRDMDPGYFGSITLTADPEEGSRFEIQAGQNILLRGHYGQDRLLHIAQARVQPNSDPPSVELQVDEKARDLLTLQAIHARDRETSDPVRRRKPTRRNSRSIEDRIAVFDCEQGAGQFTTGILPAGQWTVIRIPVAEEGSIVRTEIVASVAAEFSAGIWDREITPAAIAAVMPEGPLDDVSTPSGDPWDEWSEESGLIIAWGGPGRAAGYDPYQASDSTAATGKLVDNAQWYYSLPTPPWIWLAIWPTAPAAFSGRMLPGID